MISQPAKEATSASQANLPNFLVIGAYKSGTTALYQYLNQHPEVYMPPLKETNFFALEGTKPNYSGPGDETAPTNRLSITHLDNYQAQFQGLANGIVIGEASPLYLYSPQAPKRIKNYIPDAKLIAILRHPAERAYSNFLHLVRDGREKVYDFRLAWEEGAKRIQSNWAPIWHLKELGFYHTQLCRYFEVFPPSQIKVILHKDLVKHPQTTLEELFDFLEIGIHFQPDLSFRPNQSGIPKNKLAYKIIRRAILSPLNSAQIEALKQLSQSLRSYLLYKPKMPPQYKAELIEVYREDILQLEDLLDRDLSHWLT